MRLGELYGNSILVRVRGAASTGPKTPPKPFCAGILINPETQRAVFAAPILAHLVGQHADKLRQHFARMGWRASIVRGFNIDQIHAERLERMRMRDREAMQEARTAPVKPLTEKPRKPRGWARLPDA